MAKYCPDNSMDAFLDYIGLSNEMTITTGSPLTYADAHTGSSILARFNCTSGCFSTAPDVNGRKLTISARTSGSITTAGTAQAICLTETTGGTLRYVTIPVAEQVLTAGGTIDTSSFKINLQNPT